MSCVTDNSDKTDNSNMDEFSFVDEFNNWNKNMRELENLREKRTEFYHRIDCEIKSAEIVVGKDITEKIKPILNKIKNKFNFDLSVFKFLANSDFDPIGLCKFFVDEYESGFDWENSKTSSFFKFTFYKSKDGTVVISYEEKSPTHFGKYGLINIPSNVFDSYLSDDEIVEFLCNSIKEAIKKATSKLHSCMKD